MSDITDLSAQALSQAIRSRELSCRELMRATLARIDALNPAHNAIVSRIDGDELLRQADAKDARLAAALARSGDGRVGWMHGMPQAIKDIAPTAGLLTTMGSPLLRDNVPAVDGLMVQRMKAAGCIVIGKTNTPEFGLGSHTFNEVFGITRNAYDPARSAGGSSGGAAVALALHLLPVADGSDSMGSLRNPAAWNNVFGLRPSQGRVPFWPAADVWVTHFGTEGPMGRSVRDLAHLLEIQAGPDERVPLSIAGPVPPFAEALDEFDPSGQRVGWLGDLQGHLAMEDGILEVCTHGLQRLRGLGCEVEAIALGMPPASIWDAWLVWRHWLVGGRIAPFLAKPGKRALIKPEALWEHDQGLGLSAAQVMDASVLRTRFHQHMLGLFERHDVLALPSAQVWPFDAGRRWPDSIAGRPMDTYHRWMEVVLYATFAGLPCISVPVGFSAAGLPMGMQLIGRPQGERALLRLAHAYEQVARDVLSVRPGDHAASAADRSAPQR
jgi:amidase